MPRLNGLVDACWRRKWRQFEFFLEACLRDSFRWGMMSLYAGYTRSRFEESPTGLTYGCRKYWSYGADRQASFCHLRKRFDTKLSRQATHGSEITLVLIIATTPLLFCFIQHNNKNERNRSRSSRTMR